MANGALCPLPGGDTRSPCLSTKKALRIFAKHLPGAASEYFIALNNYAICFINVRTLRTPAATRDSPRHDAHIAEERFRSMGPGWVSLVQTSNRDASEYCPMFIESGHVAEADRIWRSADYLFAISQSLERAKLHDHYVAFCAFGSSLPAI